MKNALIYSKPVLSDHSKRRPKLVSNTRFPLNACQKYCRLLQGEHSAILLTFITLPFAKNIYFLSIFEWSLKTGYTEREMADIIYLYYKCIFFFHFKKLCNTRVKKGLSLQLRTSFEKMSFLFKSL